MVMNADAEQVMEIYYQTDDAMPDICIVWRSYLATQDDFDEKIENRLKAATYERGFDNKQGGV